MSGKDDVKRRWKPLIGFVDSKMRKTDKVLHEWSAFNKPAGQTHTLLFSFSISISEKGKDLQKIYPEKGQTKDFPFGFLRVFNFLF